MLKISHMVLEDTYLNFYAIENKFGAFIFLKRVSLMHFDVSSQIQGRLKEDV